MAGAQKVAKEAQRTRSPIETIIGAPRIAASRLAHRSLDRIDDSRDSRHRFVLHRLRSRQRDMGRRDADDRPVQGVDAVLGDGSADLGAPATEPLASAGVEGATTFRPGTAIAQFSRLWECCAPKREPPPFAVLITSGSDTWPSVM